MRTDEELIKDNVTIARTTFHLYKSMGPCGCHCIEGFHWIFMRSEYHQCPRGMLSMRNNSDQPADCADITGQSADRQTTISSPGAFGLGELKIRTQVFYLTNLLNIKLTTTRTNFNRSEIMNKS